MADYIHSGDKPLTDALELMNNEGVTSLPVLDNQNNVIGNISHVDVKVCDIQHDSTTHVLIACPATDQEHRSSSPPIVVHSLHLRHSVGTWHV